MSNLRLTVVPVALRAVDDEPGRPALSVAYFRSGDDWLTTEVSSASEVVSAARQMLDEAVPEELLSDGRKAADVFRLENAGVDYSTGQPNLLLTVVLPIAATELQRGRWTELVPWAENAGADARPQPLDPVRGAIAMFWRDQLTTSTAALDFLPKYFPASQVRAVYESLWGATQSDGNFQRWLTTARGADGGVICAEVADSSVREEAQIAFAENLSAAGMAAGLMTGTAIASAWDPKYVGTSGKVSALAGLAVIPAAVVAGALVGSFVSWQRSKVTGRPPSWYSRTAEIRTDLRALYAVRPVVQIESQTFVE